MNLALKSGKAGICKHGHDRTDRYYPKSKRYGECRECRRIKTRKYYYSEKGHTRVLTRARERKLGLSAEQQEAVMTRSGGRCEACGVSFASAHKACFDHDHVTGRFRGLLCRTCNFIEGHLAKSPGRVHQIMAYLNRYG